MRFLQSLIALVFCVISGVAAASEIVGVRTWAGPDSTRLVLELSAPINFRVSADSTPGRLVVQLPNARTQLQGPRWPTKEGAIEAARFDVSERQPQLIVELRQPSQANVFALGPSGSYGHRLVVDFSPQRAAVAASPAVVAVPTRRDGNRGRDIIVSIDAGHGGEDPGAIGQNGTYEKHVTLAISRAVADYLNAQEGVKALLTRDSDFFIPLQQRRRIARQQHKADIFISIHADSAPNKRAHGASVYALSLQGNNAATSAFARELAEKENKSDLIGGVAPEADSMSGVLADLLMAGTLKHSLEMGNIMLAYMEPVVGRLHSRTVHQAGFAVLREPGMVSLLVETGFISNLEEEQRLANAAHQRRVAASIGEGIMRFCREFPVAGSYFEKK
ncbi:MAG: N-acetylmuramoyl-L-alanine amidase [Moraxellaceae bacterium]|nr:N-acetylmuramoyl-L-alanine amidase [Moraxellaceae bacterium]MDZ4297391.1 N-acetylmuramoyl-L-alanine amidase [Moraxellaceae bacterium]MDZ4386619.1 N-acetylmuramoyl-L-alanine amidase [Moraxellaceae bacterium]